MMLHDTRFRTAFRAMLVVCASMTLLGAGCIFSATPGESDAPNEPRDANTIGDAPGPETTDTGPVAIVSPEPETFVRGEVTVEVTTDTSFDVRQVALLVDEGSPIATDASGPPYELVWPTSDFEDGSHTLKAVASGPDGATAQDTLQVSVDNTPPAIELEVPGAEALFDDKLPLRGTIEEASSLASAKATIQGTELTTELDVGSFETSLDLGDLDRDEYTLMLTARDTAGGQTRLERPFIVDRPPMLQIEQPTSGTTLRSPFRIQLDTGDDDRVAAVEVDFNGRGFETYVQNKRWVPGRDDQGEAVVRARVTDSAGQTTMKESRFQIDCPDKTWYRDADGDGYGDPEESETLQTCKTADVADDMVANSGDCDDDNRNAWDTCSTCHDEDEDGYYENCNRYVGDDIDGPDCDDSDPDAHPDQTTFFTSERESGGYDYNCDGDTEKKWTGAVNCSFDNGSCSSAGGCSCSAGDGWVDSPPDPGCGEIGRYVDSCLHDGNQTCYRGVGTRTQKCR